MSSELKHSVNLIRHTIVETKKHISERRKHAN